VTLLDIPIPTTSAQRLADANFTANRAALSITQPDLARVLLPPRDPVEWVFGRDGALTALDESGNWFGACSLPKAAAVAMLEKMDVNAACTCFLAPPHAAHLRTALDKFTPEQAIIAAIPDESDLRCLLACEDFSRDIAAHRLWFAAGPDYADMIESLLTQQIGLAVPAQFLRMHSTDEQLIQKMIEEATAALSRITLARSQAIAHLDDPTHPPTPALRYSEEPHPAPVTPSQPNTPPKPRLCVMTPMRFDLWNDEGPALAKIAPPDSLRLDTSDPALSSPLKLATAAAECGALLTPNFARADMPGVIPLNVPWFTWITNNRIPAFNLAGPQDRLLLAVPSLHAAALASDWPADRVHLAAWPRVALPPATGPRQLTVLADTLPVNTPDDLEDFSSHRLLWETLRGELASDPFALDADPAEYLLARMRQFDVSPDALPHDRFLHGLIVPAYQQGCVRALLKARLPVKIYGKGWAAIDEFRPHAAGMLDSHEEKNAALASATTLVDLWPWREAHPISSIDRPTLRRQGRKLAAFVQRARQLLESTPSFSSPTATALTAELLQNLLAPTDFSPLAA
jgi:hypothetical protein